MIEVEHEDAFITQKMYGLLLAGDFVQVPVLMGINSEESLYDAGGLCRHFCVLKLCFLIFNRSGFASGHIGVL